MRKVLIVTFNMGIGGLENILMNYFRSIDKKKFQIDFVVNNKKLDSKHIKEIKLSGGNVFYIDTPGNLGAIRYVKRLIEIMKKNGPYDAVHSNNEYHGGFVCMAAALSGIKIRICHSHTTSVNKRKNLYLMPIYKFIIKKFSTLNLACSKEAGEFMFYDDFKILPNAINLEKYQDVNPQIVDKLRFKLNITKNDIVLGHIGRFSEEKNQKFLIDILEKVLEFKENIYLVVVGDGQLRSDIEEYAISKSVYKHIRFVGFQNNINEYLNIFDFLLLPSFYEGLPVTIVEGQASGVNCLVSKNVTKEVDLGIGLVEFINIDKVDDWVNKILNNEYIDVANEEIVKIFNEKFYNIETASKLLSAFYCGEIDKKGESD